MMLGRSSLVGLLSILLFECVLHTVAQEGSGDPPPTDCTGYPTLDNSEAFTGSTTHESVINVVCSSGYFNTGSEQYTCTDGTWAPTGGGAEPYCAIQCATPTIAGGTVTLETEGCNYEDCIAQVACDTGFVLTGNVNIICQSNGSYVILPTCDSVDCGAPAIENGVHSGTTTYQSEVTFTCDSNYIQTTPDTAICGEDGTWSELPYCIYYCGSEDPIPNSITQSDCTGAQVAGCTVMVECDSDYVLTGSETIECIAGSGWSFLPQCVSLESGVSSDVTLVVPVPDGINLTEFKSEILASLMAYFIQELGADFENVVILTVEFRAAKRRRRQDIGGQVADVKYEVVTKSNDTVSAGHVANAQAKLVGSENLTVNGIVVEPIALVTPEKTYYRGNTSEENVSCEIFIADKGPCPSGTVCILEDANGDDYAKCASTGKDDDLALELGLGLGIPLFLLTCALIVAAAYYAYVLQTRRRRARRIKRYARDDSDTATMSGFTPNRMPTRFNTSGRTGPVYGSYFPEAWNDGASFDEEDFQEPHHRQPSYLVSLGHEGPLKRETSNFSWDFMYPHMDKDFVMPRPRV